MCPKSSNSCPVNGEVDDLLDAIRRRFSQLTDERCERRLFLNRLRNLARFGDEPMDYPEPVGLELPKEVEIALAVCHPECGNEALVIVEGGPQGCDCCGGTMCPTEIATYRLKKR